jgi:hypothetical protein
MSSSRNLETDRLTERVNITFQQVLRRFSCYDGSKWIDIMPHVEFVCNATRALGIEQTTFEVNLGFSPSSSIQPALQTGESTSNVLIFSGNSLLARILYTYKPYKGCHRLSYRRDGTPSHVLFSPPIPARRPRSPLLPRPSRFPVLSSSKRHTLSNTLTHTTSVTSLLHPHTSPFATACPILKSTTCPSSISNCNHAGKCA